jgi:hypothetical protein
MSAVGWRASQLVNQCHTDWTRFDELFRRWSGERRHDSQGWKSGGQPNVPQKPKRLEVRREEARRIPKPPSRIVRQARVHGVSESFEFVIKLTPLRIIIIIMTCNKIKTF